MSHSNSTFNAVPPSVIKEEKKSDTEIKKEFDKLLLPKTHREAQNFFTANKVILHKIINGNPTFYIEKAIKTGAGMMEKLLEIDSVQKTLTQQTDLIVQMINKNLISPVSALFTSIRKKLQIY